MKIIKVIWKDAHTLNGTYSLEELKKEGLSESVSIGYLLDENKERIVICNFIFPDKEVDYNELDAEFKEYTGYRSPHIIPKSQIIKITELKEKK